MCSNSMTWWKVVDARRVDGTIGSITAVGASPSSVKVRSPESKNACAQYVDVIRRNDNRDKLSAGRERPRSFSFEVDPSARVTDIARVHVRGPELFRGGMKWRKNETCKTIFGFPYRLRTNTTDVSATPERSGKWTRWKVPRPVTVFRRAVVWWWSEIWWPSSTTYSAISTDTFLRLTITTGVNGKSYTHDRADTIYNNNTYFFFFRRSVHMRLYSMNKREFVMVFIVLLTAMGLVLFIGLTGGLFNTVVHEFL